MAFEGLRVGSRPSGPCALNRHDWSASSRNACLSSAMLGASYHRIVSRLCLTYRLSPLATLPSFWRPPAHSSSRWSDDHRSHQRRAVGQRRGRAGDTTSEPGPRRPRRSRAGPTPRQQRELSETAAWREGTSAPMPPQSAGGGSRRGQRTSLLREGARGPHRPSQSLMLRGLRRRSRRRLSQSRPRLP